MSIPFFLQNNPSPLGFQEVSRYWDAQYLVTSSGERVSNWLDMKLGTDLAQASGAAQPILLPFSGENYLWLPLVSANLASAPDSVPLSITGSVSLACRVAADDWTPAVDGGLVSKSNPLGDQRSYRMVLSAAGRILFEYSTDGTAANQFTATSSAAPVVSNFGWLWLMCSYNSATGKVNFYTAPDAATLPTAWTLLGTEQTITAGAIFDGTATLCIGGIASASNLFGGKAKRAVVWSGVVGADGTGGTKVFDSDFTAVAEGATSFAESSSNGATVTINSTGAKPAQIVGSQQILGDGVAHFLATAAFTLNQPITLLMAFMLPVGVNTGTLADGLAVNTRRLYQTGTTGDLWAFAGSGPAPTNTSFEAGRPYSIVAAAFNGASTTIQKNLGSPQTGDAGTSSASGLTVFSNGNQSVFGNAQAKAIAICPAVLSQGRLNQLIQAMAAQSGVAL